MHLLWIPLGAGGAATVRACGWVYEAVCAALEGRRHLDLYHAALEVYLGGNRFVIENAWPSPDPDIESRGVVVEGPVWSRSLGRLRVFRYEIRCWRDGVITDAHEATATDTLTTDPEVSRRLLDLAGAVPPLTWGRALVDAGEMWSSNSVISFLLTLGGLPAAQYQPPAYGRAPGWETGIALGRALSSRGGPDGAIENWSRRGARPTGDGTLGPRSRDFRLSNSSRRMVRMTDVRQVTNPRSSSHDRH